MSLSLLVLFGTSVFSQQANSSTAFMQVNGQGGPPFPIVGVLLPRGLPQNVTVQGVPNAPFVVFGAAQLFPTGVPALGGLLDVNILGGYATLMDGLANPAFVTDAFGSFSQNVPLAATAALNSSAAFQGIVADPTNVAYQATFTAASRVVVSQGLTTLTLAVSGNGSSNVNLTTYGLSFPFYEQTYTNFFVNEDGNISFTSGNGDFTPTPSELHSQQPRICPQWTDVDVNYGGNVRAIINQAATAAEPTIRIEWNNMAAWSNTGGIHTFACMLYPLSGNIDLISGNFNNAMIYDQLTGIAPGSNIFPTGSTMSAVKDLSAMANTPITGVPRESFWEWFGIVGMTYFQPVPLVSRPYDLTGRTVSFYAVGAGAAGAFYIGA
jgi:hypothetical protein